METHSSLVVRINDTRCILLLLGALAACSGDPSGDPTDAGAGGPLDERGLPRDASAETSTERPDGAMPDSGGGSDAPPNVNDAPARDSVMTDRDAGAADATSPPPTSDARSDVTFDGSQESGIADVSGDAGRTDVGIADAGNADAAGPTNDAGTGCNLCASYGPAEQAGRITSSTLNALSGIGASRRNPGVIYVHNDR